MVAHRLFSYGTLQLAEVQLSNFGRTFTGTYDRLPGFELANLQITDPAVIAISGTDSHPILRFSGESCAFVAGEVFELSDEELSAADAYEVGEYARVMLTLESGTQAWVYADAQGPNKDSPSTSGSLTKLMDDIR
ncbi:gamma-glutamylcyclotransferase [Cryobacterium suzukii]|uniref:Gamma-glutamylcyclotransferase n=1 Tax=Cryobacterium suzukii TaxID=1259198 RepID=A0A4R9AF25_9MICO|nr:gamma-glutamylcyclotransferase [Cryobacterium suzukii]